MTMPRFSLIPLLFALAVGVPATVVADGSDGAAADGSVEVVEFFWYGCPHCYRFQPHLHQWLDEDMPDYVDYRQVPALLSPNWEIHARAFYAAQLMGELDRFHFAFYDAIHKEGESLDSRERIAEFAGDLGIDGEKFASTMDSFAVENRLEKARDLNREYGVRGTPSVGIGGQHLVSPGEVSGFDEMIDVIDGHVADLHGG